MELLNVEFVQKDSNNFAIKMFDSMKEFSVVSDNASDILDNIKKLIIRINHLRIKVLDKVPESEYDVYEEDLDGTFELTFSLSIVPDKENTYVSINVNSRFFYSVKTNAGDVEPNMLSLLVDVVKFINSQNSEHTLLAPPEFEPPLY